MSIALPAHKYFIIFSIYQYYYALTLPPFIARKPRNLINLQLKFGEKMKAFLYSMFAGAIATLLTGCIAGTPVREKPDAGDPIAERPKYCVGDSWTWDNLPAKDKLWYSEVTEYNDDGSYALIGYNPHKENKKYKYYEDANHKLYKKVNLNSGEELEIGPDKNMLDFPLFIGKQWIVKYFGTSTNGNVNNYTNRHTVTNYEKLKTDSLGEIDVFRIVRVHKLLRESTRQTTHTYFYSPELKIIVVSKPSWRSNRQVTNASVTNCE